MDTKKHKRVKEQKVSHDVSLVTIRTEAGTSLSAPKLAGMLALAWDSNPKMTKEELLSAMKESCHPMTDEYYKQGKLGKGELSDYSMMLGYSGRARFMIAIILAELVLFLVVHLVFSWETLVSGIIAFLLFSIGVLIALIYCGLSDVLIRGYSFLAIAFSIFLLLYLFLRPSPYVQMHKVHEPVPIL